jgi:hypothetical protein
VTRIGKLVQDGIPHIKAGLNGNWYVFCTQRMKISAICYCIEKSLESIYYSPRHQCYAIRIRSKRHIAKLKQVLRYNTGLIKEEGVVK